MKIIVQARKSHKVEAGPLITKREQGMEGLDRKAMLGPKIRRFRTDLGMSQTEMAGEIGISPSYLNLIEHNQRPVTVPLLFKLGQAFELDLKQFAEDDDAKTVAELAEVFSDPLFRDQPVRPVELQEFAARSPNAAQAMLRLYQAYRQVWENARAGSIGTGRDPLPDPGQPLSPVEAVRDMHQREANHFPELEDAAEALWQEAGLERNDLFRGLTEHLSQKKGIAVKVMPVHVMTDTLRRYDPHGRRILLSEALLASGRCFQLASQIAALAHHDLIESIIDRLEPTDAETRNMLFVALCNYFAGAVLMPYESFRSSAQELRHDLELLRRRFGASFEQVSHRLTTLQRPGARGIPFFFIRVDAAGNVSKRLNGGGFQFARYGGTCPRWVVHEAFRTPGQVHTQVARMPDETTFFTIARTLDIAGGWHEQLQPQFAVGLGCEIRDAKHLVYADGLDLPKATGATPVGVSCRLCERLDCSQRAHPPLNRTIRADQHMKKASAFTFEN